MPIIQNSGFDRATFMQDNAPCHKAKVVMSYLSEKDFEIMDWPPQSPDLNPVENLWKILGEKVMERNPTNTEDLWVKLQEEWSKISIEDCQELIRSCSRCAAVIESKGSFTKYWLYMYFYCFWLFTLFFSILSLIFGRSKFENKYIIVIILFYPLQMIQILVCYYGW